MDTFQTLGIEIPPGIQEKLVWRLGNSKGDLEMEGKDSQHEIPLACEGENLQDWALGTLLAPLPRHVAGCSRLLGPVA